MREHAGMGSPNDPRDAGRMVRVAVGDEDAGELFRLSTDGLDVAEYRSDVPWQSGVNQRQSLVLDQIGAGPRDTRYCVDPVDYLQLARLQFFDIRILPSIAGLGKRRGRGDGNLPPCASCEPSSRPAFRLNIGCGVVVGPTPRDGGW